MQHMSYARDTAELPETRVARMLNGRTLVMVGMMGAGKSSVGRRLANRLGMPFVDADTEIELAANSTIPEIFEQHGEAYFRDGERRVILRLLDGRSDHIDVVVQESRKQAGLDVSDRIRLRLVLDAAGADAVRSHAELVSAETLAVELDVDVDDAVAEAPESTPVGAASALLVSLEKIQ